MLNLTGIIIVLIIILIAAPGWFWIALIVAIAIALFGPPRFRGAGEDGFSDSVLAEAVY